MVTKRTPIKRDAIARITPQILATYAIIKEAHGDEHRKDEYNEAARRLDELLGRKPWQTAIEDTIDEDDPPDYVELGDWKNAHSIRVQLDEALKRG